MHYSKNIKQKVSILFILISLSFFSFGQDSTRYYFGIRLTSNGMGNLIRYGVIAVYPNKNSKITYLTKTSFSLQVAGLEKSKANPQNINLWEKYQIHFSTTEQIWKLKYSEYPYDRRQDNKGWAQRRYAPSDNQLNFLKKYGYKDYIGDFIYGEHFFQLLIDMQSTDWQNQYINQ
jgi:hypothetical protein